MRPLTDLRVAAAALRATLSVENPRGSAVLEAARVTGRAARRAGYEPAQLSAFLGRTLLPALHAHHPGPGGDWLWERVVAETRAAHAEAQAGDDTAAARPVVYRVDADDVITRVNAAWDAFATANGAPALATHAVGTSVWAHVGGAETQELYATVYAEVRRSGRTVVLPFRCDAPAEQRWMQLTVRSLGRGHLQVASTLIRRAVRPPVSLLDPAVPRDAARLCMCSWCKRVRPDDGPAAEPQPWVDVEALPDAAPRAGSSGIPHVVHDVCPDCAAGVRAVLASA